MNGPPRAPIQEQITGIGTCLCGCDQRVRGPRTLFASGHAQTLTKQVIDETYGGPAGFALAHTAGRAASGAWQLTPWRPESAVGRQARGRVFEPIPLTAHGFAPAATGTPSGATAVYTALADAGERLDVGFADPFAKRRVAHAFANAGPVWREARERLAEFDRRPAASPDTDARRIAQRTIRTALVRDLLNAPDGPPEFILPVDAALDLLEAGRAREAEAALQAATTAFVLDVDSWAHLANRALGNGRLADGFGFAEAAVAVAERSFPDRFSGTLPWSRVENRPYLRGRHALLLALWRLDRFADAQQVAADTLWLNPGDEQGIRGIFDDIAQGVPWVDTARRQLHRAILA